MQKGMSQKLHKYIKDHLRMKHWRQAMTVMACIVVFCTTYALILPALTMTGETYCGHEEHTHTDACYDGDVLICEVEEHTHSMSCYSNPKADVESEADWEKTIPTNLGTVRAKNVVAVAKSQIGYTESTENYEADDDGSIRGYTRYGAWYGIPCGNWDAMFASFCLNYAGVPQDVFPYEGSCAAWVKTLKDAGIYAAADDYSPRAGDLIFFDSGSDGVSDHVGIVSEVTSEDGEVTAVQTIEGDCHDTVKSCEYDVSDRSILGYGILRCDCYDDDGSRICENDCDCECHESDDSADSESGENENSESSENKSGDSADKSAENSDESADADNEGDESSSEDSVESADESAAKIVGENNDLLSVAAIDNFNIHDTMTIDKDLTASGATQASVKLQWDDGRDHTSESYTVTLKKSSDDSTVGTATLNADNEFAYTFTGLDSSASYYVDYDIDGFKTTESAGTSASTSWKKASSLQSGNTYVLVYNNTSSVSVSDSSLAQGTVSVSDDTLTGSVPTQMQWTYTGNKLKNNSTGTYLTLSSSGYAWWSSTYSWGLGTSGTNITYSNNKISSSANNNTRYLQGYNSAVSRRNSGTSYTLYQQTEVTEMLFTITATQDASDIVTPTYDTDTEFEHNKTIDSLGDGESNPDTTLSGNDFYRLYLDMTGKTQPIDLVVVVDASGSMSKTDMTVDGQSGQTRVAAVSDFMNGTTGSGYTEDGFVSKFLSMNSENQISVVRFYGPTSYSGTYSYNTDSDVTCGWTSTAQNVDCSYKNNNGTDYEAGLLQASSQFAKVADNDHKKVMIFLSDGVPTFYIDDSGTRQGTGVYADETNVSNCKQPSKDAFDAFRKSNPDVDVYTVGVSEDVNSTDLDSSQSPDVLKYMASSGNGTFYAVTSDMSELSLKLMKNWFPYGVTITDKLSKYVRYYGDKPDVKVTMTNRDTGDVTTLYENGKVLDTSILKSVYYLPDDTSSEPTGSTGIVRAVFNPDYSMNPNYIYTLSFNVQTTQTAYNEYADNGDNYGSVTGDLNTDYGTNTTSSDQPGFYSNNAAWVTYTVKEKVYNAEYKHPVVQVKNSSGSDDDDPTHTDSKPEFEHNKTIDSLNDGGTNTDTDLTGKDLYRLYLDMTGESDPIDLLLVVDASGSMGTNSDIDGKRRDVALDEFINGTDSDEGFVSYFLGLSDENKISVIEFAGDGTYNGDYSGSSWGSLGGNNISKSTWSVDKDSEVLMDWKTAATVGTDKPDVSYKQSNGTDYEAGLKLATEQFKSVADDGHRKIMIFLSDGVPTFFIIDQNDVGKKSTYNESSSYMKDSDLSASNVGMRYGHGFSSEYADVKSASMQAFDDFVEANPSVNVYTVGVSSDITEVKYDSDGEILSSPDVLKYMAEKGGGNYYALTDSFSTLKPDIQNILFPRDVTITDMLSKYVRYYGDDPDVKVTMKSKSTGEQTVLYENGAVTSAASGILTSVTYTDGDTSDKPASSTGMVKAIFDENYCFDPDYTYTLSFNVKTTQTAYEEYEVNGYGYKDVVGDDGTDYLLNETSSGKPGFHSNSRAYVTYKVDDEPYTEEYDHPVVQVSMDYDIVLPQTGGIGTIWFTIVGTLMVVGSLLFGYRMRRKRERRCG